MVCEQNTNFLLLGAHREQGKRYQDDKHASAFHLSLLEWNE
jgi:hypothetical protein